MSDYDERGDVVQFNNTASEPFKEGGNSNNEYDPKYDPEI